MTTADVSLVAKESIVVEKLKNYMPAQFFCPTLYIHVSYTIHTTKKRINLITIWQLSLASVRS